MRTAEARRVPGLIALGLMAALTSGCSGMRSPVVDVLSARAELPASVDWRKEAETYGPRYRADPRDPVAAVRYAQALRHLGHRAQAVAVLEQASLRHPHNRAVLGAFGRALADVGRLDQALEVLSRAHTPDQPDWRILSVQGAVLDQLGRHEEARRYYANALKIAPDEPSVLSNLGLSYALTKDLAQAEATLRRATAKGAVDRRVRQNLALVVGLQGRFEEAERIARADLPPEEAAENVSYLRAMLAQPNRLALSAASSRPRGEAPARR